MNRRGFLALLGVSPVLPRELTRAPVAPDRFDIMRGEIERALIACHRRMASAMYAAPTHAFVSRGTWDQLTGEAAYEFAETA